MPTRKKQGLAFGLLLLGWRWPASARWRSLELNGRVVLCLIEKMLPGLTLLGAVVPLLITLWAPVPFRHGFENSGP